MPPKEGREAIDVLLVEDDEQVRKFIARLLTNAGYRIEEAANEQEALSAASRTEFGVVVTDLGLPGIGGAALIERLAESHEATTFVIVTGALDEGLPSSPLLDRAIVAVLTKPFDRDELARVVARASDIHEARQMGDQAGRGGLQVPKCVLIVEHNPDDAELLKRSLSDLYDPTPKILVAGRVEEAEELLGQAEIDLVLSDLGGGFGDGRGSQAAGDVDVVEHRGRRAAVLEPRQGLRPLVDALGAVVRVAAVHDAGEDLAARDPVVVHLQHAHVA
ncbi:MAG TPA: response regulator, partial [Gemmatimonadetes bacterium]|nr:response regulator [Gemmatimonadota bacterium]